MRLAGSLEIRAKARAFGLPAADADVRVLALREDPGVAAGEVRELDHGSALVPLAVETRSVRGVSFERDAVHDPAPELEPASRGAVRPVGTDHDVCPDRLAVDPDPLAELDARTLSHGDPVLTRRIEQKHIEPPALRHPDHRAPR